MVSYYFFAFGDVTSKLAQIVLINNNNNLCEGISQKTEIEHKQEECNISMFQVLPIRNGSFFDFGAATSKLAHIVLINNMNNMCEGISQKLKIEHKQEKCNILQIKSTSTPTQYMCTFPLLKCKPAKCKPAKCLTVHC